MSTVKATDASLEQVLTGNQLVLIHMAREMGVKINACQMIMDVMNLKKEDFMEGIEVGGAVNFLDFAKDANISLTF